MLRVPQGIPVTLLLLLLFSAVWLAHLDSVALTPPADNIEQLTWMRSLEWGYYKHPPVPTWVLWAAVQLIGWSAWTTYLLGALLTLASLAIFASLLRDIHGRAYALVGLMAALGVTFYNGRLNYYNHNVVLMFWVALSAWLWWRILTRPRWGWWLALGVVGGLGMLSKYQYAVAATGGLWLFVRHGLWRDRQQCQGLALAVVVGGVIFMPHVVWLLEQARGPIAYAMHSSLGADLPLLRRLSATALWLLDWLFNRCLPAVLLLLGVHWAQRGLAPVPLESSADRALQARGNSLLLCWGVLPPAFMAAMGVLGGVDLQLQWGTAFALWTVPVLMAALGVREATLRAGRGLCWAVGALVLLQAVLVWQSYDTSVFGRHRTQVGHWREFPSEALAQAVAGPARQALGGPIKIISGPASPAGALALRLPEKPRVLIDGDLAVSPWISAQDMERDGVLELWPPGAGPSDVHRVMDGWGWRVREGDGVGSDFF
ncbi:glycosyltransferase [Acidovorax delafieldii 2AN]|uniref:Glycosyltransferase n=2 Tax=Acidovorax delafieldii TaxID=47920 RepID=C5T5R8_ACIDE|nr:glycosyltransferase [Acidovorax delafieldii 2AN]